MAGRKSYLRRAAKIAVVAVLPVAVLTGLGGCGTAPKRANNCLALVGSKIKGNEVLVPGEHVVATVTVRNCGNADWKNEQLVSIAASGSSGSNGDALAVERLRALKPGQTETVSAPITGPSAPGRYHVQFAPIASPHGRSLRAVLRVAGELGGLDLQRWCKHQGYQKVELVAQNAYGWSCVDSSGGQHSIDMNAACKSEYNRSSAFSHFAAFRNAHSWSCFDSAP